MEDHVKILGVLHIVRGVFYLLIAILLFTIFAIMGIANDDVEVQFVFLYLQIMPFLFFIFSVPSIIGGINFLKLKEWSRVLLMIVGIIGIPDFPIGTALGIYTIIITTNQETHELFERETQMRSGDYL